MGVFPFISSVWCTMIVWCTLTGPGSQFVPLLACQHPKAPGMGLCKSARLSHDPPVNAFMQKGPETSRRISLAADARRSVGCVDGTAAMAHVAQHRHFRATDVLRHCSFQIISADAAAPGLWHCALLQKINSETVHWRSLHN
eukprot:TRINITY_DN22068_c0_g1_i1.p1 TRINITY_DN22068_c0_g1~~TRINITY_DN22068_c0_g1_i1.p1  ORF type:complete len:142 (+),score=4.62 TRINITY_DN22068_c0_g1_i1:2-427(+)